MENDMFYVLNMIRELFDFIPFLLFWLRARRAFCPRGWGNGGNGLKYIGMLAFKST